MKKEALLKALEMGANIDIRFSSWGRTKEHQEEVIKMFSELLGTPYEVKSGSGGKYNLDWFRIENGNIIVCAFYDREEAKENDSDKCEASH